MVAWPVSPRYKELKVFIKSIEVTKNLAENFPFPVNMKVCTIVGFIFITVSVRLHSLSALRNSHLDFHSFVQSLVPFFVYTPNLTWWTQSSTQSNCYLAAPSVFVPPGIMLQSSGLSITGTYFFRSCWEFPPCYSLAVYFVIMEKTFGHLLLCKLKPTRQPTKH